MLKIQRKTNGKIVFTLSGRIEAEDLDELRRLLDLEEAGSRIALDLKDVTLVDREATEFLTECKANRIQLENCPTYVRERMTHQVGRTARKNAPSRAVNTPRRGAKP